MLIEDTVRRTTRAAPDAHLAPVFDGTEQVSRGVAAHQEQAWILLELEERTRPHLARSRGSEARA